MTATGLPRYEGSDFTPGLGFSMYALLIRQSPFISLHHMQLFLESLANTDTAVFMNPPKSADQRRCRQANGNSVRGVYSGTPKPQEAFECLGTRLCPRDGR